MPNQSNLTESIVPQPVANQPNIIADMIADLIGPSLVGYFYFFLAFSIILGVLSSFYFYKWYVTSRFKKGVTKKESSIISEGNFEIIFFILLFVPFWFMVVVTIAQYYVQYIGGLA